MYRAKTADAVQPAKPVLEEELEESSVTSARQGLLPLIERIQKNPAMRVLIRKHGKPRAVLMSAQTYDALMKLATLTDAKADAMSREERIEAAYQRLQDERPAEKAEVYEFPGGAWATAHEELANAAAAAADAAEPAATPVVSPLTKNEVKARLREMQEKIQELDSALEI